jgi:hypothetical protein
MMFVEVLMDSLIHEKISKVFKADAQRQGVVRMGILDRIQVVLQQRKFLSWRARKPGQ